MLQALRRHRWLFGIVTIVVIAGLVGVTAYRVSERRAHQETHLPPKPTAPPDLQKFRDDFASGVQALQREDGADAVKHFSSFDFGNRPVEEYRLYYLANAHQLAGSPTEARLTLAKLWSRSPRMIHANEVAMTLGNHYANSGDWRRASDVYAALSRRAEAPAVGAAARLNAARSRLHEGDVAGALYMARGIVIHNPAADEAKIAISLVRALTGTAESDPLPLTPSERLDRASALVAGGRAQAALDELAALERVAPHLAQPIQLQRGIALHQLRRYEDSNEVLEPLTSGPFRYAIPALRHAAKNYAIVSSAIDPTVYKTVREKKRVGTVKVRVGKGKKRRTVRRPKYQTVSRQVKLIDLAKKNKKEEYDRLASERLQDLLSLEQVDDDLRLHVLNALITRAQAKNQDDYVRELVTQVVKLDPLADPALQHFWDKGWAAYERGDLDTARTLFRYIADTYTHPNVKRQSEYWYARTVGRQGKKEEAEAIYRKLASAPYTDLYASHSIARGAPRPEPAPNPLKENANDWGDIAEKEMPQELRLAYELTALSMMRDAYHEIRRNMRRENVHYAEALMADVHHAAGNAILMYRSIRRAWPQLATVEQDSVPPYFIRMYYPQRYREEIEEHSKKHNLDPSLVRALILQESYYNPKARSSVGATGLMQLMPPTAKEHAGKLRIPFAVSRLENPEVNIQLGTFHLRMLLNMFRGNDYMAIASYNAGQGNVLKWRRAAPGRPLDEFLEDIPFQETRNYVKRVTMLRSAYDRLTS